MQVRYRAGDYRAINGGGGYLLYLSCLSYLLYTGGVLLDMECCIRLTSLILSSSIMSFNITNITHKHYTDIYPLSLI